MKPEGNEPYRVRTRTSAQASTHARAVRTRAALISAAERLALSDPSQLSATNVAATAGVSRGAFYLHFDSIPALANALLAEKMHATATDFSTFSPSQEWTVALQQYTRHIVAHFDKNRALYKAVRKMTGSVQANDGARDVLTETITDLLRSHSGVPSNINLAAAAEWMAGGAIHVLDAWIDGRLGTNAECVAENLYQLLPTWFRKDPRRSAPGATSRTAADSGDTAGAAI